MCGATITEDLELDHDLTCAGDGLIVGADGITITLNGHTIRGSGTDPNSAGIRIAGRSGVNVSGPGMVRDFRTGVLVAGSESVDVKGITAMENGFAAPSAPPFPLSASDGIHVTMSQNVQVKENVTTRNADDGINLHLSTDVQVVENVVDDNRHDGIRLDFADGNEIAENVVMSHDLILPPAARVGCGMEVFGSKNNRITENVVVGNDNGIRLRASAGVASTGNAIKKNHVSGTGAASGSVRGIHLRDSSTSDNSVDENTVTNHEAGIAFTDGAPTGNRIQENRILANVCEFRARLRANSSRRTCSRATEPISAPSRPPSDVDRKGPGNGAPFTPLTQDRDAMAPTLQPRRKAAYGPSRQLYAELLRDTDSLSCVRFVSAT